jgi:hypothetical protein
VAKPRWRAYRTLSGRQPVRDFLMAVPSADRAAVVAAMEDVAAHGLAAARHLRGDVWEVRADGDRIAYRVLFSAEGASRSSSLRSTPLRRGPAGRRPPRRSSLPNGGSLTGVRADRADAGYALDAMLDKLWTQATGALG